MMSNNKEDSGQPKMRHIVRVGNTDILGEKQVGYGLTKIKGIGVPLASAICNSLGLDKTTKMGLLSEDEVKQLDSAVRNPAQAGIPSYLLNNQKDYESGEDSHVIGPDIKLHVEQIKKRHMRVRSYKGFRYPKRLPVRGQRTKSNFRRNKGKATGVRKKKARAAMEEKKK